MRPPPSLIAGTALTGLLLAGCTSHSSSPATSAASASPTAASSAASSTAGTPIAPTTLAATLQRGLADATSVHLGVVASLSGQTVRGSGDATLAEGAIDKADVTQGLPGGLGTVRVVTLGASSYAKLPSALATDRSKPWVRLDTTSSNLVAAQLARIVTPLLAVASPGTLVALTRGARSASDLGPATVDGTATRHYRVTLDPTSLPSAVPSGIAGSGTSLPVDLYADSAGRLRQVHGTFRISGQAVTPTITFSDYNAPVTVTAPPASQIAAD